MSIKCFDCGKKLDNGKDPCPKCGSKNKTIETSVKFSINGNLSEIESKKEQHEIKKTLLIIVIIFTIIPPFVGTLLSGVLGFIFGLVTSLIAFILGFFAYTKNKEIERIIYK